jgi:hypothetical protein
MGEEREEIRRQNAQMREEKEEIREQENAQMQEIRDKIREQEKAQMQEIREEIRRQEEARLREEFSGREQDKEQEWKGQMETAEKRGKKKLQRWRIGCLLALAAVLLLFAGYQRLQSELSYLEQGTGGVRYYQITVNKIYYADKNGNPIGQNPKTAYAEQVVLEYTVSSKNSQWIEDIYIDIYQPDGSLISSQENGHTLTTTAAELKEQENNTDWKVWWNHSMGSGLYVVVFYQGGKVIERQEVILK